MYESIWTFVQIGGEMVVELICVGTELLESLQTQIILMQQRLS